jgi:hypothetical protein
MRKLTRKQVLSIPQLLHIDGGGGKHRESLRGKAASFALWLKNNGYPSGYRVLCMNCNLAIGISGTCPHRR